MQVGVTILAVPSPATSNSATLSALDAPMAQAESDLFGSLRFIAHLPILQSVSADLRTGVDLTFGGYQISVNRWGTLHLTDGSRSPVASITTSQTTNDEAKLLQPKAPTRTTTPRVIRASRSGRSS